MSSDSQKERARLKEEYKEHYRKMRDIKEQLRQSRRTHSIQEALNNMSASDLMASFDDFVFQLKSRIAHVEARLDLTMQDLSPETGTAGDEQKEQRDEEARRQRARETLQQVKLEMGQLYSEIERRAEAVQVEKTVGVPSDQTKTNSDRES